MRWKVPKIWQGGDVWILGGGPSVVQQFSIPDEIVQKVKSKQTLPDIYSEFMEFLHDKHVIGINVAYLIGNWIDIVFFGDNSFFLEHQNQLYNYPGIIASCAPNTASVEWVKFVEKDRNKQKGISPLPSSVSWNNNSGAAAISLAVHLGARRIYLLGFDMKMEANTQHWHSAYIKNPEQKKNLKKLPFERHLRGFPQIAADAKNLGIEIINVCPDSAIEVFKKVSLQEIINQQ